MSQEPNKEKRKKKKRDKNWERKMPKEKWEEKLYVGKIETTKNVRNMFCKIIKIFCQTKKKKKIEKTAVKKFTTFELQSIQ